MRRRALYLEERIAIVRDALNEKTLAFEQDLPTDRARIAFHQFVTDCGTVLDGFDNPTAIRRLKR